jgi:DNA-binding transcriptional LysR family regulator
MTDPVYEPNQKRQSRSAAAKAREQRPRRHALSPALLARVFHQPALIYFNAVAQHLSMREAARQLSIASSAIARQVGYLEDSLGLELFLREDRGLVLTPAGEILFRHTRNLVLPFQEAIAELDLLRGLKTGTVHVATVESVGLSLLPGLVAEFGQSFPRLHLCVSVLSSHDVAAKIIDGSADIGFSFIVKPVPEIAVAIRRDVQIGVVMTPDHPLAALERLTLADTIDHPFAVATPEISIREVIEPFFQRSNLARRPFVEVDSIRMLVELACTHRYASIMTQIGAQNELDRGELIFKPLADAHLPTNRFGIIVKAGATMRFAPAAFLDHAKRWFETASLPGAIV